MVVIVLVAVVYLSFYLQAWKRSYSARLPQFLNLTTSKTKQFCETSSIFDVDNIKNEAILRDFFHKWKLSAGLTASYQCVLRFFHSICLKYIGPGTKKWGQVIRSAEPVTQNHLTKPDGSDASKCNRSQEISNRTSWHLWWTCLLYCVCHAECIFADPLQMFHACQCFWISYKALTFFSFLRRRKTTSERLKVLWTGQFFTLWLRNVLRATAACTFSTCQRPKVHRTRHNHVHLFDMSIPKGGPNMRCFVHVDLVLRTGQYFTLLTSKCASRHNAVHFFDMSTAKSAPAFSSLIWTDGSTPAALASLLSDPLEPQIIRKTQWIATFLPFRTTASSFVWLCLFSDFSDLCFSISPSCRKFEQYRII